MKSREQITCNGRAAFYASIFDDLRNAAMDCGWALGLHGSLSSDLDIMAMPWTENAEPVEVMIQALSDCFEGNPFKDAHTVPYYEKPNNRVVYTMTIWGDFYLDINVIQPKADDWIPCCERLPHFAPEKWRKVLVTLEDLSGRRFTTTAKYNEENEYWYEFIDGRYYDFKVIAWQPKPEYYKGE